MKNIEMEKKAVIMSKEILRSYDLALQPNNAPTPEVLLRIAQAICEEDEGQDFPIPNEFLSKVFSEARKKWSIAGYKELRNTWEGDSFASERKIFKNRLTEKQKSDRFEVWSAWMMSQFSERYGKEKVIEFCNYHNKTIPNGSKMIFDASTFKAAYALNSWVNDHTQYISMVK